MRFLKLLCVAAAVLLVGCPSSEIKKEVSTLRSLHSLYRDHVEPRSDLSAENKARVLVLEQEIDAAFVRLEEITD